MTFDFFKKIAAKYGWYVYRFEMFSNCVDLIIYRIRRPNPLERPITEVLLIRRGGEVEHAKLALPGGFVNTDELLTQAAVREGKEETNINIQSIGLASVGVWDAPKRDPRQRTISHVYVYEWHEEDGQPIAGDDAASLDWYDVDEILRGNTKLAFDHFSMLLAARPQM
jgi:8-oxo-dGTP diphosphatase